jgi:hypothetical protein
VKPDYSAFPAHPDHGTLVVTFVLLVGLGSVLLFFGVRGGLRARRLLRDGVHAVADVLPVVPGVDTHGRIFQRIRYRLVEPGRAPLELLSIGPHLHRHRPGSAVAVIHPPDRPTYLRADEPAGILLPWLPLTVAGAGFLASAFGLVLPNL